MHAQPIMTGEPVAGVGQSAAWRVLEVAAAGGHHLAVTCPPETAKNILARRLVSLLPLLDEPAALEVTALHELAGVRAPGAPWLTRPPLQTPDPRISVAGLVGSRLGRPGLLPLAHRGVLLLEPATRFSPPALETLLQPLDHEILTLGRVGAATSWPARIQLLLAANPCTCPNPASSSAAGSAAPARRQRGLSRVEGLLLNRSDIQVDLGPLATEARCDDAELTAVAGRVATARAAASERWGRRTNAEIPGSVLSSRRWRPPAPIQDLLDAEALTKRHYERLLRIAWTIADLAGHGCPNQDDVTEAIQLGAQTVNWCTSPGGPAGEARSGLARDP